MFQYVLELLCHFNQGHCHDILMSPLFEMLLPKHQLPLLKLYVFFKFFKIQRKKPFSNSLLTPNLVKLVPALSPAKASSALYWPYQNLSVYCPLSYPQTFESAAFWRQQCLLIFAFFAKPRTLPCTYWMLTNCLLNLLPFLPLQPQSLQSCSLCLGTEYLLAILTLAVVVLVVQSRIPAPDTSTEPVWVPW